MAQQLIPDFLPDFRDIKDSESLARIEQYLAKLQRQLKYQFAHIDEGNIQDGAITEKKLTEALSRKIADTYGNSSEFSQTASKIKMQVENLQLGASSFEMTVNDIETRVSNVEGDVSTLEQTASSFGTRITNAEGDISTINQTVSGISSTVSSHTGQISDIDQKADNISLAVSQEKVWRAATETALNTALSAAGITKAAGLLWYDTTNNVVKRWTGTAWANTFVNTSQIVIDDDSIDIGTTGTLNMQAGGKITMSSASSIIIGGSPFSVGGTNLFPSAWLIPPAVGTTESFDVIAWASPITNNGIENYFKTGEVYTVSYSVTNNTAKPAGNFFGQAVGTLMLNYGSAYIRVAGAETIEMAQGETRMVTQTIEWPPMSGAGTRFVFYTQRFDDGTVCQFTVRNLKIEKGTVATDWSPSPQDTIDALDALDGRLGDVETRVQVFYQASKPTYTAVGDLWYDTDSDPLEIWKCTNVSTQAHSAFIDPVLTRALSAATTAQNTANSKITTFVGNSTPTALAAGDLWLDTGNKNIWKRATAAGTGGWVQYLTAAGYLITTGITIDGTDLTVKATGNLNLAADGNLNVQNGGNLNVLNGGDIEVNNGGDINVESGGKINVSATDLIISGKTVETYASDKIRLEVSVGVRNYYKRDQPFTFWSAPGASPTIHVEREAYADCEYGFFVRGAYPAAGSVFRITNVIDSNGWWTVSFDIRGTQSVVVGCWVNICDEGMAQIVTTNDNTFKRVSVSVNVTNYETNPAVYNFVDFEDFEYAYFRIRNIKIEKGNKATDFIPANEDPARGVKTAGIEIGPGIMRQYADLDWSMTAGSGASEIGMANKRADGLFIWGGGSPAAAKIRMWMDGSARFDQIMIGNSGVNQFTQMYPYTDADNADDLNSMILKVFVPADCSGVQSLKLSFALEAFRAYSKGAASGGAGTSGVSTAAEAGFSSYTGYAGSGVAHSASSSAQGISVSETADHRHSYSYTITVLSHTHGTPSHTHPITYGIYAGPVATSCQVIVDGVNIGSFASLTAQDITAQLTKSSGKVTRDAWHIIELKPNGLTRIVAQAFLVAVVATATNAIY